MVKRYFPKSVQELTHWYERYISPLALIAGFLSDNFILLKRVDLLQTNALLIFYLVVAALGIVAVHLIETGRVHNMSIVHKLPFILIAMQFAFGGLFSGYLSLYSRSASFTASWLFVVVLAILLLANERFTRLYARFSFQISMYFAVLFSFLIFFLPVVLHRIGPVMFLLSGAVSILLTILFLWILALLVPEIVKKDIKKVGIIIVIIFAVFNVLYFLNLIPPLTLAIKDAGVYHVVNRDVFTNYQLQGEITPWYEQYLGFNTVYHMTDGEPVYVYTAIFAPTGLSMIITDEWQHYDTDTRAWVTTDVLNFPINGGREDGYRGYTIKSNPTPGDWRVNVKNSYGQLIGRVSFTVVGVATEPDLVTTSQ